MAHPARLAEVVRSGLVEAIHRGHVAVCDPDGALVARAGDPETVVFARSSTKPLQAAVSLSLIPDRDELTEAEVAVMCGSHEASDRHVAAVGSILVRAGLGAEALRCPPAPSHDHPGRSEPRFYNCSGKHAGMLLACVRQGWPTESYPEPDHPLQLRVLDAVRDATGEEPAIGVDGCGVPVHGVSVRAMARLYARLAAPGTLGELEPFARRAVAAMRAEPFMVGGDGIFDTRFMREEPSIAVKRGAEGLLCAALPDRARGIALKAEDGSERPTGPVLMRVLAELGAIDPARAGLRELAEAPVLGGGRPVGVVRSVLELDVVERGGSGSSRAFFC